jgi:hypothetical protein
MYAAGDSVWMGAKTEHPLQISQALCQRRLGLCCNLTALSSSRPLSLMSRRTFGGATKFREEPYELVDVGGLRLH